MADEVISAEVRMDDQTTAAAESAERNLGGLVKSYVDVSMALRDLGRVASAAWDQVQKNVDAAMQDEASQRRLHAALIATGQYTAENEAYLRANASALQARLAIGDEQILQEQALALTLGANVDQLEAMTIAARGASTVGIDQATVMRGLAQSIQGNVNMLGRYFPALRDLTEEELRNGAAIEYMREQFGLLAEGEAKSFEGRLTVVTDLIGDTREVMGGWITASDNVNATLATLADRLRDSNEALIEQNGSMISLVDKGVLVLIDAYGFLIFSIDSVRQTGNYMRVAFSATTGVMVSGLAYVGEALLVVGLGWARLLDMITGNTTPLGEAFTSMSDTLLAYGKTAAGTYKDSLADIEDQRKATEAHQLAIINFKEEVETAAGSMREAREAGEDAGDGMGKFGNGAGDAADSVDRLTGSLRVFRAEMDAAAATANESILASAAGIDDALARIPETLRGSTLAALDELINRENIAAMGMDQLWTVVQSVPPDILEQFRTQFSDLVVAISEGVPGAEQELRSLVAQMDALGDAAQEAQQKSMDVAAMTTNIVTDLARQGVETLGGIFQTYQEALDVATQAQLKGADRLHAAWRSTSLDIAQQITSSASSILLTYALEAMAGVIAGEAPKGIAGMIAGLAAGAAVFGIISAMISQVPRAARGGIVEGPGPRGQDSVLMLTAPGEGIIPEPLMNELRAVLTRPAGSMGGSSGGIPSAPRAQAGGVVNVQDQQGGGRTELHIHNDMLIPASPSWMRTHMDRHMRRALQDIERRRMAGFR